MTLASLLSGVLNTKEKFALSSGAPILLNVVTLAPLLMVKDQVQAAYWTSAAVTLAGVLQCAMLWWGVKRLGLNIRIGMPVLSDTVKRVLALAIPGAVAGGAVQINSAVSNVLTGTDPGASSVLYNADRLYQLPIGIIGVAVGMALVPRLSRHFAVNDEKAATGSMDDGIVLSMAFTLPAALALLIMPFFLVDGLMTRGEFRAQDAVRTAEVLRQFAWGVPAFVLAKVLMPPFFARHRTKTPATFSLISVVLNIVLGAGLWFWLPTMGIDGAVGLAIATSVAGWLNVFMLAGSLAKDGIYKVSARAWSRLARMGLASIAMGAFVAWCAFNYPMLKHLLWKKELASVVVTFVGLVIFMLCAFIFRAVTVGELRHAMRRDRGIPGVPVGDAPGGEG